MSDAQRSRMSVKGLLSAMQDPLDVYLIPVREMLLHKMLTAITVFGGLACVFVSADQSLKGNYLVVAFYICIYLAFLSLIYFRRSDLRLTRALPSLTLGVLLTVEYWFFGHSTFSYVILYTLVIFTCLMWGIRYGFVSLFVTYAIIAIRDWNQYRAILEPGTGVREYLRDLLGWAATVFGEIALISLTLLAISIMFHRLHAALTEKNALLDELQQEINFKERALDALKLSEDQFNRLFEHSHDPVIFISRKDGKIALANSAAEKLTDIEINTLKDKTIYDFLPIEAHGLITQIISQETSGSTNELDIERNDSKKRTTEVSATAVEGGLMFLTFRDITERKQLEEKVAQSHKLEAIGQLAGGIAHDFNNSLQVIIGFCELARFKVKGNAGSVELEKIYESGKRAQNLVAQLLAFSRQQQLESLPLDLNVAIEESLRLVNRLIGEHIVLNFVPATSPVVISGDRTQIEQVVLNLCINARDAIHDNGTLSVKIAETRLSEEFCARSPWAEPGSYARMTVQDTGSGMTAEIREKIFDPFFTTKEEGKGTGLGLSSVLGIVQQHGGLIELESEPGKGTAVSVYFPLAS